jgi:hypothetical protein
LAGLGGVMFLAYVKIGAMSDALLVVLIFLPVVISFLLKSNAGLGFLALCGGFTAITLSGSDIQHLVGQTKITSLTSNNIDLALLLLPLFLTLVFTFKSIISKKLRYFSLIPALCAGGLLAVVAAPMFGSALQTNLSDASLWHKLEDIQSYIVAVGLISSLGLVWAASFSNGGHYSKKHK